MSSEIAVEMCGSRWKRYPAYKDSGVEWIEEVPEHWGETITSALFMDNKKKNKGTQETNLLSLSYGNIIRKDINTNDGLLPDTFEAYQIVDSGYIILRLTDLQNDKKSLRVGHVNEKGIITSAYTGLRKKSDAVECPKFFYYLLYTYDIIKVFYGMGAGVRQSLNFNELRKLRLLLPLPEEQSAIAAFLDRETVHIGNLIKKKERQIELLQEKRAALISHVVTKGLNPDVKMKYSGVDWLGNVPEHWDTSKIIRYAYLKTGGTPDRSNMAYWENGTINWASSGEVNKKKIFETNTKITPDGLANSNAMILPINSIMIGLNGQGKTKGTVAILKIKSSCNQSLAAFICDEKKLHFNYLFYYLESKYKELRGLVGGSLRDGLSLGHLKSIYSPLPPFFEQHSIAIFLDQETVCIDTLTIKVRESISKLREYRIALISAAVTGKIDVRGEET